MSATLEKSRAGRVVTVSRNPEPRESRPRPKGGTVLLAIVAAVLLACVAWGNRSRAVAEGRLDLSTEPKPWAAVWCLSVHSPGGAHHYLRTAGGAPLRVTVATPVRARLAGQLDSSGRLHDLRWLGKVPASAEELRTGLASLQFQPRTAGPVVIEVGNLVGAARLLPLAGGTAWLGLLLLLGLLALRVLGAPARSEPWLCSAWMLLFLSWLVLWRLAPHLAYTRQEPGLLELPQRHLDAVSVGWVALFAIAALVAAQREALWAAIRVRRYSIWATGILLLLLTRWSPLGRAQGTGHKLWLKLGPLPALQTIELVKIAMLLFSAAFLYETSLNPGDVFLDLRDRKRWLLHFGGLVLAYGLALLPVVAMGDFGPTLLLLCVLLSLLILRGQHRAALVGLAGMAVLMAAGYWLGVPSVWRARMDAFLHPFDMNMQLAHGLWAVRAGGLWGAGLGAGIPFAVPVVESDYLLAGAAEELGWLGAAAILALLLLLCGGGIRTALRRTSVMERYLAAGASLLLGLQGLLIAGGVLAALPLTGVTFPLFSQGGTSIVVNCLLLGLLLGIECAPQQGVEHPLHRERIGQMMPRLAILGGALAAGVLLLSARLGWIAVLHSEQFGKRFIDRPLINRIESAWRAGRQPAGAEAAFLAKVPEDGVRTDASGHRRLDPFTTAQVDPRSFAGLRRGRILDSQGVALAQTDPATGARTYAGTDPGLWLHTVGNRGPQGPMAGLERDAGTALVGRNELPFWRRLFPGRPEPVPFDLRTTLDARLQAIAQRALGNQTGAVVLTEVSSGEIRAAADWPTADLTHRSPHLEEGALVPRWCRAQYPAGSVFKLVVTGSGLEEGVLSPTTTYRCDGAYTPPGSGIRIHDYAHAGQPPHAHGQVELSKGMAVSCNCFFAQAAQAVGPGRLGAFASRIGFDTAWSLVPEPMTNTTPTLRSIPSRLAAPGKRWPSRLGSELTPSQLALTGIGQLNVRTNPLHMALFAGAIANEGRMCAPRLVTDTEHAGQVAWSAGDPAPQPVMKAETAHSLRQLMEKVVEEGTGRRALSARVRIAGKTGTADDRAGRVVCWFVGYAPADRPRLAVAVAIEAPSGATGGETAAPIAARVLDEAATQGLLR